MIGQLTGTLIDKNPPEVMVDCHGVGYEVSVPMSTFYNLPALGEKVKLLTHFVVREDAQLLYGFATAEERAAFRQLVKISGVGPRTALSVLSGMSVADLAQAITQQEAGRLVKVPGIGKKTAERLLLELKGKLGADIGAVADSGSPAQSDILQALIALGYNDKEAALALKALPADVGVSEGIKLALKALALSVRRAHEAGLFGPRLLVGTEARVHQGLYDYNAKKYLCLELGVADRVALLAALHGQRVEGARRRELRARVFNVELRLAQRPECLDDRRMLLVPRAHLGQPARGDRTR
jgi:Holliday junction DNA helicase RuvA